MITIKYNNWNPDINDSSNSVLQYIATKLGVIWLQFNMRWNKKDKNIEISGV
jgi:hypothetical protein